MLDLAGTPFADAELERALIALVLKDGRAIERIGNLEPDDLTDPSLSAVLEAAQAMAKDGKPVSAVTLLPRLRGIVALDGSTGLDVVGKLTVVGNEPKVEEIARRLKEIALRRGMSDYLAAIAQQATDEKIKPRALVEEVGKHLETFVKVENDAIAPETISSVSEKFLEYLKSDVAAIEITTGLADLDASTAGWHRGQFAIVAGRPSMGKSCFALSSLLKTAQAGHGVMFFSLEMSAFQLAARALTDLAYTEPVIHYKDLRPGKAEAHIRCLENAAATFKGLPIQIDTTPGLTAADIFDRTKRAVEAFKRAGKRLDCVFIDHLLKVSPSGRYAGQPVKELDEISSAMCDLAKKLDVAVIGLHQLNRQNEDRDNQRALLSDLRGSGSLEQDADLVLFCYRPAYRLERLNPESESEREERDLVLSALRYTLELQIAKQRQGPTDTIELWCDIGANAVRNKSWR